MLDDGELIDWQSKVTATLVEAYYPQMLQLGGTARQRTQVTHTMLTALAATGTTLGLALPDQMSNIAIGVGLASFLSWAIATWCFAAAVSLPTASGLGTKSGPDSFLNFVLETVAADVKRVNRLTAIGRGVTFIGIALTALFLLIALTDNRSIDPLPVSGEYIYFDSEIEHDLIDLCAEYSGGPFKVTQFRSVEFEGSYVEFKPVLGYDCSADTMTIDIQHMKGIGDHNE